MVIYFCMFLIIKQHLLDFKSKEKIKSSGEFGVQWGSKITVVNHLFLFKIDIGAELELDSEGEEHQECKVSNFEGEKIAYVGAFA